MRLSVFHGGKPPVITIERMVERFLRQHARQSRDYPTYVHNCNLLLRFFKGRVMSEITPALVDEFIATRLASGVSRSTTNRQRACLSKMFSCAQTWGLYVGDNPVRLVKKFPEPPGRVRFLKPDEADALMRYATPHLKPIIFAALHTGGRLQEVLKLRWRDVDIERRIIYFDQSNTKSGKQREVPLSDQLGDLLGQLRAECPVSGPDDFVFTFAGHALGSVRTAFSTARIRAGLGRDVTFHTLRHSFASWFVMNGGDLFRLQRFLGHSTITLTQRYAHFSPDFVRAGAQFIGAPTGNPSLRVQ